MSHTFFYAALLVPRVAIIFLWLASNWFDGVFKGLVWPLLGSIFFPYALLWYSVVINWFDAGWNPLTVGVMLLAILADVASEFGRYWTAEPEYVS